jgi:hypothetical protein
MIKQFFFVLQRNYKYYKFLIRNKTINNRIHYMDLKKKYIFKKKIF